MNVTVKLPDGSTRQYPEPVSALRVAQDISPHLAKAAVAAADRREAERPGRDNPRGGA